MAISQFPAPSAAGGGGASLPEGAVAKLIEGKLTSAGYNYPETLAAGTYRINNSGNTVIASFGDNGTTETVSGSKDVTIANPESSLSFDVASNFAGNATVLVDLPTPMHFWSQYYPKSFDFNMSPSGEHMIETRGETGNNNYIRYGLRNDKAIIGNQNVLYIANGDGRYSAAAIDDNGNGYIGYATGTGFYHNIYKIDAVTGATTLIFNGSGLANTWLNTNTGSSGLAVSPDGQTIVYVGYRQARAVVSTDGGANWTDVTLPGSAWSSSVQNGYNGPTLKYQNGYFMQPGDAANGRYFLSTDGLTWASHTVSGANFYVMDFATDGTTFMFATGNLGAIYKTTDHASFTAMAVSNIANSYYWSVEYGNGKWVATNQSNAGSGDWVISEDTGANWTLVNPNDYSMPYGNAYGKYNARWQNVNHNSTFGMGTSRILKVRYDSKLNTFAWAHAYYTTAAYGIHNMGNLNLDDYYMWVYSRVQTDNPPAQAGVYDVTWSSEYNRWYYTSNYEDNWGQSMIFSYNPDTGNIRTEPVYHNRWSVIVSSDTQGSVHSGAPFGTKVWYSGENGSNQWGVWFTNETATDIANGIFWEYPTLRNAFTSGGWTYRLKPHKSPNGGGMMMQAATTSTAYLYNQVIDADGVYRGQFAWQTDTLNFARALESGSVKWDTVNKTVTAAYGVFKFTDLPYEQGSFGIYPTVETDYDDYYSALPTNTSYSFEKGNTTIYWDGSNDQVSVSTNGGASSLTYPALNDIPSVIFESQGVFYVVATHNGTGRIYSISDFSTSNYVELSDMGYTDYPRVGWQHVQTSPYSSEANPVMFTANGQIIQLFSNSNYQPPANLFVYDLNLEEL